MIQAFNADDGRGRGMRATNGGELAEAIKVALANHDRPTIDASRSLILSQVALSLVLPVPMIALLILMRRRDIMGTCASGFLTMVAAGERPPWCSLSMCCWYCKSPAFLYRPAWPQPDSAGRPVEFTRIDQN